MVRITIVMIRITIIRSWLTETNTLPMIDDIRCAKNDTQISKCDKRISRHDNCEYNDGVWLRCHNDTGMNIFIQHGDIT